MKNLVEISRGDIAGQFVHEEEFLAGTLKDSHMLKTVLKREPSYFSALESALNMADASQRYKACQNLGLKLSSQKETMQAGAFCYLLANASRSEEITHELKKIVIDLSQFSVEIQKKHEEAERIIEEEFNSFIESSEPIDQGAYSLIYKMDIASQPQNFKTALKEEGVPGQDSAIKVLKVYEPGLVESEYKRQVLGRQIFTKAGLGSPYVPEAYVFKDIHLKQNTAEKLNNSGSKLTERAEFLMMDFVPGRDFQYFLLAKVLKLNGEKVSESEDSHQLYQRMVNSFELESPASSSPQDNRADVRQRNMGFAYHFLKKNGVKVNPEILKQFKVGLKTWEGASFTHGDLHERNLMFTGTEKEFFSEKLLKKSKVAFLDFGPLSMESDEDFPHPDHLVLQRLENLNS